MISSLFFRIKCEDIGGAGLSCYVQYIVFDCSNCNLSCTLEKARQCQLWLHISNLSVLPHVPITLVGKRLAVFNRALDVSVHALVGLTMGRSSGSSSISCSPASVARQSASTPKTALGKPSSTIVAEKKPQHSPALPTRGHHCCRLHCHPVFCGGGTGEALAWERGSRRPRSHFLDLS